MSKLLGITQVKKVLLPPYKRQDIPLIAVTIIILLGLFFTVSLVQKDTNTRTEAASVNAVEPENGTLAGNVSVVNDPNASGGKYVRFGVSVQLQPVSWWENQYNSSWSSQYTYYNPLSTSGDSWDIYNLAYGIDGPVALYLATGKTQYLDQALVFANNLVATAKQSSSISTSQFKDSYLTWVNHSHPQLGNDGKEYPLFESYGWRYVTRLLRVIKQTPALYSNPTYKSQYDSLLAFSEVNIFDKWYSRGVNSYIYRSHTHMAAHWAYIAMDLSLMTTDSTRLAKERQVFDDINHHLPNYNNASLHGQMIPHPVNASAYFWDWEWGKFAQPGSDVSHGNNTLAYIVEAHDLGLGGWTSADMAKFVVLFDKIVWPSSTTYAAWVDGSGTGNGWFPEGFVKLGRYDANLQKRIEGITVGRGAQFYGNGALNAKTLGATQ